MVSSAHSVRGDLILTWYSIIEAVTFNIFIILKQPILQLHTAHSTYNQYYNNMILGIYLMMKSVLHFIEWMHFTTVFQGDLGDLADNWYDLWASLRQIQVTSVIDWINLHSLEVLNNDWLIKMLVYVIWLASGKKVRKHSSKFCDVSGRGSWSVSWAFISETLHRCLPFCFESLLGGLAPEQIRFPVL